MLDDDHKSYLYWDLMQSIAIDSQGACETFWQFIQLLTKGLELPVFSAGSKTICIERDADLHEKVVVE